MLIAWGDSFGMIDGSSDHQRNGSNHCRLPSVALILCCFPRPSCVGVVLTRRYGHRHNLRDRLGTQYLQSSGLNKVYHSDLTHNVSQLVCEKSSFWGDFGIIIAAKHGAMAVLSSTQRNAGHRLSSIQINLKYA